MALLEVLRPPVGYRTSAALGTTYSAELVATLTTLLAMDGVDCETRKVNRVLALRAVQRLKERVRIAFHQARVRAPEPPSDDDKRERQRILLTLDQVLRPARGFGESASFHPKVWVVRQEAERDPDDARYVLVVGSRNLTESVSWEFGVALTGVPRGRKGIRLPRVGEFVEHVCRSMDEAWLAEELGDLSKVRWDLPSGVRDLEFDFFPGRERLDSSQLEVFDRVQGRKLLVVSPFLDAGAVQQGARRWPRSDVRLVTTSADLYHLSDSAITRRALRSYDIRVAGIAPPDAAADETPPGVTPIEENEELLLGNRGLHAKIVACVSGARTQLVAGSPNFTARAWDGRNCEAFVYLDAHPQVGRELLAWSDQIAGEWELPDSEEVEEAREVEEADARRRELEALQRIVRDRSYVLRRRRDGSAQLSADPPLPWSEVPGCKLYVSRLQGQGRRQSWKRGSRALVLPTCPAWEETLFLRFHLSKRNEELTWLASVEGSAALAADRDDAIVSRVLAVGGLADYLRYLRSLLDGSELGDDDDDDDDPGKSTRTPSARAGLGFELRLEELLKRIGRSPELIHELGEAIDRGRGLLESLPAEERGVLRELFATWETVRLGWGSP